MAAPSTGELCSERIMSSHIIASLADACRRSRVYEVNEFGNTYKTSFRRDWHHPSFDFSRVLHTLDLDEHVEAFEEFVEAATNGTAQLPFPECLYICQHKSGDAYVLRLVQSNAGIAAESFIWSGPPNGRSQIWYKPPMAFSFYHATGIFLAEKAIPNDHLLASDGTYDVVIHRLFAIVAVGTALLARPVEREVQPGGQALSAANSGRERGNLKPIPEIITISLGHCHSSETAHRAIRTDHIPRRPHNRRAHHRHLRSGKVIPVRASAIHGGGDPRHFEIIP